jgi:hypothetical protein
MCNCRREFLQLFAGRKPRASASVHVGETLGLLGQGDSSDHRGIKIGLGVAADLMQGSHAHVNKASKFKI